MTLIKRINSFSNNRAKKDIATKIEFSYANNKISLSEREELYKSLNQSKTLRVIRDISIAYSFTIVTYGASIASKTLENYNLLPDGTWIFVHTFLSATLRVAYTFLRYGKELKFSNSKGLIISAIPHTNCLGLIISSAENDKLANFLLEDRKTRLRDDFESSAEPNSFVAQKSLYTTINL